MLVNTADTHARTHTETYVAAPGLAAINTEDCKEEETRLKS